MSIEESVSNLRSICGLEAQIRGFKSEVGIEFFDLLFALSQANLSEEYNTAATFGFLLLYCEDHKLKDSMNLLNTITKIIETGFNNVINNIQTT